MITDKEPTVDMTQRLDTDDNRHTDKNTDNTGSFTDSSIRNSNTQTKSDEETDITDSDQRNTQHAGLKGIVGDLAPEEDTEDSELSKLRCGSVTTEELAERERQKREKEQKRQKRCADYPGLAFGSAMFGSDTMMKVGVMLINAR